MVVDRSRMFEGHRIEDQVDEDVLVIVRRNDNNNMIDNLHIL